MMNVLQTSAKSIPIIVVLLVVLELVWSNTLVASGRDVSATDRAIAHMRHENEDLSRHVASASALPTIAARAAQMGFVTPKPAQFVMIGTSNVALRPQ